MDIRKLRDLLRFEGIDDALRDELCRVFAGMTAEDVALPDLLNAWKNLVDAMVTNIPNRHRQPLLLIEPSKPDWTLLNIAHARDLPAVQWRLQNIRFSLLIG